MKRFFCAAALGIALCACSKEVRIAPGRYAMMSFTLTLQALQDSIEISRTPILVFRPDGKSMTVERDIDFGCFTDSAYQYRLHRGVLQIDGPTDSKTLWCQPSADGKYLTLVLEEKYIQKMEMRRTD